MAKRRVIVQTPVGAGTPRGYHLACPVCTILNATPRGGLGGIPTVDGVEWYPFDCSKCGCRYKAPVVPLAVGISPLTGTVKGVKGS